MLGWNEDWSEADRRVVTYALDSFPWSDLYIETPPSRAYAAVWVNGPLGELGKRRGDYRGLIIEKSRLNWPHGRWTPKERPFFPKLRYEHQYPFDGQQLYVEFVYLSTHRSRGSSANGRHEWSAGMCGSCFTALPVTGRCDFCA